MRFAVRRVFLSKSKGAKPRRFHSLTGLDGEPPDPFDTHGSTGRRY